MTLHLGDCLDVMARMAENSVDAIVTDPPYGMAFMGKDWDKGQPGIPFWIAALRVAKPGAHLLAFGGTRTFHRLACAIEDAGWEIRDTVMWVYGSGFPKSHNIGNGWGTALKPAWEPVIVARKPLQGTVAANVQTWGTGAMNVDGCRVATNGETPTGSGNPCRDAPRDAIQPGRSGGNGGNVTPPQGRWPANLIHDGSDEVLAGFPVTTSGSGNKRGKGHMFKGGWQPIDWPDNGDTGSAARFFYCAKASRAEREAGLEGMAPQHIRRLSGGEFADNSGSANSSKNGATITNHHPTVKPVALMRYLCRLVTPPGGVILDPFAGSGTTGIAAVAEGFQFIGVELDADYYEIARRRIEHASQQERLVLEATCHTQ